MIVGIVGHEAAKFTAETKAKALDIIRELLSPPDAVVCSGHCPLGGIDIWAEEVADELGCDKLIFPPKRNTWEGGYKQRNLEIAKNSDIVHCLVVKELPATYKGMRFNLCYHCGTKTHVKSGGCWTAKRCKQNKWWEI